MTANSNEPALCEPAQTRTRQQPAFWKRWCVSMLAVYPPLVCLVLAQQLIFGQLPLLVSLFLVAFCLTGLSTGIVMPFLNRHLSGWLHR